MIYLKHFFNSHKPQRSSRELNTKIVFIIRQHHGMKNSGRALGPYIEAGKGRSSYVHQPYLHQSTIRGPH